MTTSHNIPSSVPLSVQRDAVNAFMLASRTVFIVFLPISVTVGILSLFIEVIQITKAKADRWQDVGLAGAEAPQPDPGKSRETYNGGGSIRSPTSKEFNFRKQLMNRDGTPKVYLWLCEEVSRRGEIRQQNK
jgi:hypothetical protein